MEHALFGENGIVNRMHESLEQYKENRMDWLDLPLEEGLYLHFDGNKYRIGLVKKGRWQLAQNPEELYFIRNDLVKAVRSFGYYWYGPISQPST